MPGHPPPATTTTNTTTTTEPPLLSLWQRSEEGKTKFRTRYPGIQDYDALKQQQLRYKFGDHAFALQWQAMQRARWKYHPTHGKYQAPPPPPPVYEEDEDVSQPQQRRPRVCWDTFHDVQQYLDQYVVEPVVTRSQSSPPHGPRRKRRIVDNDDDDMARVDDLRNDICYHMQLLLEKGRGDGGDVGRSDSDSQDHGTQPAVATDAAAAPRGDLPRRAAAVGRKSALQPPPPPPLVSVTAVEKGSDLYFQTSQGRRRRQQRSVSHKNPPSRHRRNDDDNDSANGSFPTLAECAKLMSRWDGATTTTTTTTTTLCGSMERYYQDNYFAQWRHMLSTHHSLLWYGNGSKYHLLSKFCHDELHQEGYVLQVDGFDPNVTVDSLLDLLVQLFLNDQEPDFRDCCVGLFLPRPTTPTAAADAFGPCSTNTIPERHDFRNPTVVDRAVVIGRALAQHCVETPTAKPIFLVIHSLERSLGNARAQDALAALVRHAVPDGRGGAALRLVASLDHVDASAALWSVATADRFHWVWTEIHTHRPYVRELAMLWADDDGTAKQKARIQSRATGQAARVLEVLKNLAPRYGEVMQVLAKLQLRQLTVASSSSSSMSPWVNYTKFRTECKNSFAVDKDAKLRALQTELTDHRLMISKTEGPSEFVSIPYGVDKLQEIIAYKRSAEK